MVIARLDQRDLRAKQVFRQQHGSTSFTPAIREDGHNQDAWQVWWKMNIVKSETCAITVEFNADSQLQQKYHCEMILVHSGSGPISAPTCIYQSIAPACGKVIKEPMRTDLPQLILTTLSKILPGCRVSIRQATVVISSCKPRFHHPSSLRYTTWRVTPRKAKITGLKRYVDEHNRGIRFIHTDFNY